MLVAIQVCSVTKLVLQGTGVETVQFLAPVSMVRTVILWTDSADAGLLMAVGVLLAGLALTAPCPAAILLGEQIVAMLVCVGTMECVIRLGVIKLEKCKPAAVDIARA